MDITFSSTIELSLLFYNTDASSVLTLAYALVPFFDTASATALIFFLIRTNPAAPVLPLVLHRCCLSCSPWCKTCIAPGSAHITTLLMPLVLAMVMQLASSDGAVHRRHHSLQLLAPGGPLTGGPQCRMSNLRNGYVPCHYFLNFHVDFKMV